MRFLYPTIFGSLLATIVASPLYSQQRTSGGLPGGLNNLGVAGLISPCDLISGGCASAYSVVARMRGGYLGNLFTVYRSSDAMTKSFGSLTGSIFIDAASVHTFCDGTDCYFTNIYDQASTNNLDQNVSIFSINRPLLDWMPNGLPRAVLTNNINITDTVISKQGGHLRSGPITNLPGAGSRTLFMAADNAQWSECCDNFGVANVDPTGIGSGPGRGFTFFTGQKDPNTPTQAIFGVNGEYYDYTYGAYPPGYAQIIGLIKYNASENTTLSQILTSSCIPNDVTLCSAFTTYSGTPNWPTDLSNGGVDSIYVTLNYGTDATNPGGHFQSGLVVAKATTTEEDATVMQALSTTHFTVRPSPCSTTVSTLTALAPNTDVATVTPQTYYGIPTPNLANAVAIWSTSLVNPYYNGPLFRVQRTDNGVGTDIYALGCDADAGQITVAGAGTTLTVSNVFDQTGNGWTVRQPQQYGFMQPALSATGMNGKACLQFTPGTDITFTGSITSGVLTVSSAPSGTLRLGQYLDAANIFDRAIIVSQLTGTTGGQGTYSVPNQTANISSRTITAHSNPHLMTDVGLWPNTSGSANNGGLSGLINNMTIEAAWQTTASVTDYGNMITMPGIGGSGWWFGNNSINLKLSYSRITVPSYVIGPTWSSNQAHFGYLTTNGAGTQNLTIGMDGTAPVTGTTTDQIFLAGGTYYRIGAAPLDANPWKGCIAMVAVYNDMESTQNLSNAYNMAKNKWGAP